MHHNIDAAYMYDLFFTLFRTCIITVPVEHVALIWNLLPFVTHVKNTYLGIAANVSEWMTLLTDMTIVEYLTRLKWV
ncbi:MAG: hypothetical protein E6K97_11970 [Thaumarchaeota archaeon]|nr:MAG: hypothetical protein E6K97_11970 [Nitrososphaerota archaeon]